MERNDLDINAQIQLLDKKKNILLKTIHDLSRAQFDLEVMYNYNKEFEQTMTEIARLVKILDPNRDLTKASLGLDTDLDD
jgi:flagellar biosynthesis/type III secretory pathway chaperone